MGWRSNDWPAYQPRPKVAKLSPLALERVRDAARRFVARSIVLRELIVDVQLARSRLYFWCGPDDAMARVTPLSAHVHLLETPRGSGWSEYKRGSPRTVLSALERDVHGSLHGLGSLARKPRPGQESVQHRLHRDFGVPIRILAEPRDWYAMHRTPAIAEADGDRHRVLVRFEAVGPFGAFHGTCLYAFVDGAWDCYAIKPSAAASIRSAEEWLVKRRWQDWG